MPDHAVKYKSNMAAVQKEISKRITLYLQDTPVKIKCPKCLREITVNDGLNVCLHCNSAGITFARTIQNDTKR